MPLKHVLAACLVAVIWGANFVVIDAGLAGVPPLLFLAMRFVLVVIPAIFFVPRPDVPFRHIALIGSVMSLGQFGLLYTALHLDMPPGLASLVLQAQVMFTVLIAAVSLREKPSHVQMIGILIGGVGLGTVALGRSASTPAVALLLSIAAALAWAIGNVLSRRLATSSGLSLTVWSATVVPGPLFVLSLLLDGPAVVVDALGSLSVAALLSTLYTAVLASLVGYGIWNSLLARYSAASVAPFSLLVPPVGLVAAWLAQGEVPSTFEAAGGVLLLAGVAVTVLRLRRPMRRLAPDERSLVGRRG